MLQDKIHMPTSSGGIMRYFEDYKSKLQFKPIHIVTLIILIIVVEFFLHRSGWLG